MMYGVVSNSWGWPSVQSEIQLSDFTYIYFLNLNRHKNNLTISHIYCFLNIFVSRKSDRQLTLKCSVRWVLEFVYKSQPRAEKSQWESNEMKNLLKRLPDWVRVSLGESCNEGVCGISHVATMRFWEPTATQDNTKKKKTQNNIRLKMVKTKDVNCIHCFSTICETNYCTSKLRRQITL